MMLSLSMISGALEMGIEVLYLRESGTSLRRLFLLETN